MDSVVTIQNFYNISDAVIARSFLEAHGIYAWLPDWNYVSNAWHHLFALQGIRLCVLDSEQARASELLAAAERRPFGAERPRTGDLVIASAAYLLVGIPHPIRKRRRVR